MLAIVVGMRHLGRIEQHHPESYKQKILRRAIQAVMVSLLALLGTLPLGMYYFNQVSLLGPLANLIFIPLLGFIVVPVGLTAIFVHPLSSHLAIFFFKICAWVVSYSIELIQWLKGISWGSLQTFTPNLLEISLYFLLLTALVEIRRLRIYKVAIGGILLLIFLDLSFWIHVRYFDPRLRVTTLDVGQGSATLMELPKGKTVLVDGGGFNDNSNFDVGKRIVAPFLRRRKIQTVDVVVLSHPNSDHLNGLLYILDHFSVRKILSNHEKADTLSYQKFQTLIHEKGIDHPDFITMAKSWQWDRVTLEILNPPEDFASRKTSEGWRSPNNNSLVLKVSLGNQSLLFAGDLMIPAEETLVAGHPPPKLRSTVLIAPHHGSRSSSSPLFVETVHPKIAVFSAGWQNPFGFPHPDVLLRYRNIDADILRTDLCGAVGLILR